VTVFRTGRLDVQVTGARATLAGRIDDVAQLGAIASLLAPGDVVIDLAGVTFVSSIGLRGWVRLVRVLRERGSVTLAAVSDVLIVQLNMIAEFRGSVQIASFHAGYLCPACGAETTQLVDAVRHAAELAAMSAPRLPCPECGAAMDLADFPERYLSVFAR
jgi:hypothetical protein